MEDIVLSWLVLAAFSPLAAVLLTWALFVFHTYRREWRTLDLFLVGVLATDLIACLLLFSYGLLQLLAMNMRIPQVCALFIWGLTAVRTIQVTMLASMVVDRTLTVRWPYKYRFSVRRNQVRYHLTVLAVIGIFVGVAAVFARTLSLEVTPSSCSALHVNLDNKFSIFIICLQGASLLTHFVCAIDMQVYFCHSRHRLNSFAPEIRVSSPYLVAEGRQMSPPEKKYNMSKRPYLSSEKNNSDIRWNTVTAIVGMCYVVNHLPYLITIVMITFFLNVPSPWLDNGAAWLAIAEAFFLPFVVCIMDSTHLSAIIKIFHGPDAKSLYIDPEDEKYHYADELTENKVAPRNLFGSRSLSTMTPFQLSNTNSTYIPGSPPLSQYNIGKKEWAEFFSFQGTYYGTLMDPTEENLTFSTKARYCDSLVKSNSMASDLQKTCENDHIYASLSDKSELSSSLSDNGSSMESIAADDDFEFHNTKDHGEEIQFSRTPNERKGMEYYSHYDAYHNSPQDTMSSQATTASAHSDTIKKKSWNNLVRADDNSHLSENKLIDSSTYRIHHCVPSKKLIYLKHHKTPRKFISHNNSLSMNDLDCINNGANHKSSEEIMYILPVRSDSRLSLYQIHLEENENESKGLTKAVSEGNLHFHSDQNMRKELCVKPFIKDSFEKHSRFSARGMTAKKILKQVQRKELERVYLQSLSPEVQTFQSSSQENQNNFNRKSVHSNNVNPAVQHKSNYKNKQDAIHKNNLSSNNSLNVSDSGKYSYFDNGDICWHDVIDDSDGDIKKIFVSDYL